MIERKIRDCTDQATCWPHIDEAVRNLAQGRIVVMPTDTVYGVAADAFTPRAVRMLLRAKGRDRRMPTPVLIGDIRTLDGLATDVPPLVRDLLEEFWPGALTVILKAQPSLRWDLGDTEGTVALRMPDNELALALLRRTGPLAVSSANKTGNAAALTAREAAEQLGAVVSLYLDGGQADGPAASTIIDATGERLRVVREGALSVAWLAEIAPELLTEDDEESDATESQPQREVGPAPEADAATETAEGATPEAADDPVAQAEPASEPEPVAVSETEPASEVEPVTETEPETEPVIETETETEPEPAPEPQPPDNTSREPG